MFHLTPARCQAVVKNRPGAQTCTRLVSQNNRVMEHVRPTLAQSQPFREEDLLPDSPVLLPAVPGLGLGELQASPWSYVMPLFQLC